MKKKENQRVVLTRRLLYEALVEILKKKHISQVTVTELCAKAGINRATFYTHYSTPNDILLNMLERHAQALDEIRVRRDTHGISFEQAISESCRYLYEHREYFCIFIKNGMDKVVGTQVMDAVFRDPTINEMRKKEELDMIDSQLIVSYILSGCYAIINKWLIDDLPKTPDEIAGLLMRIFTNSWLA